jgi:hypothetical protein
MKTYEGQERGEACKLSEATIKDARRMRKKSIGMQDRSNELNDVTPGGGQGEPDTRPSDDKTERRVGLTDTQGAQRTNRPSRPQRKK